MTCKAAICGHNLFFSICIWRWGITIIKDVIHGIMEVMNKVGCIVFLFFDVFLSYWSCFVTVLFCFLLLFFLCGFGWFNFYGMQRRLLKISYWNCLILKCSFTTWFIYFLFYIEKTVKFCSFIFNFEMQFIYLLSHKIGCLIV